MSGKIIHHSQPENGILDWIRIQDNSFAQLIDELALEYSLIPKKDNGLTFIFPAKAQRLILTKLLHNNAENVALQIRACIIPIALHTEQDFLTFPIGSELKVAYTAKVQQNGVVINDSHIIKRVATYNNKSAAIWQVVELIGKSAWLPVTGRAYNPADIVKKRCIMGGAPIVTPKIVVYRERDAAKVEKEYVDYIQGGYGMNPYLTRVVGFLYALKVHCDKGSERHQQVMYERILPLLDLNPLVSYYIIFEPYRICGSNDFLVSDKIYHSCYSHDVPMIKSVDYLTFFSAHHKINNPSVSRSKFYSDRSAVISAVRKLRESCDNPRDAHSFIAKAYTMLESRNSIGGLTNVYPSLFEPYRLRWADQFRSNVNNIIRNFSRATQAEDFTELFSYVKFIMPGINLKAELMFLSPEPLEKRTVAPKFDLIALYKFLNTSDFLYVAPDVINAAETLKHSGTFDIGIDFTFYDRNYHAHKTIVTSRETPEIPVHFQATLQRLAKSGNTIVGGTASELLTKLNSNSYY